MSDQTPTPLSEEAARLLDRLLSVDVQNAVVDDANARMALEECFAHWKPSVSWDADPRRAYWRAIAHSVRFASSGARASSRSASPEWLWEDRIPESGGRRAVEAARLPKRDPIDDEAFLLAEDRVHDAIRGDPRGRRWNIQCNSETRVWQDVVDDARKRRPRRLRRPFAEAAEGEARALVPRYSDHWAFMDWIQTRLALRATALRTSEKAAGTPTFVSHVAESEVISAAVTERRRSHMPSPERFIALWEAGVWVVWAFVDGTVIAVPRPPELIARLRAVAAEG